MYLRVLSSLAVLLTGVVHAQVATSPQAEKLTSCHAVLSVTVTDPSGGVISGAFVMLREEGSVGPNTSLFQLEL